MATKRKVRSSGSSFVPEFVNDDAVVKVPVVEAGQTVTNAVSIGMVGSTMILWFAKWYGIPLTADTLAALLGGINALGGLAVWFRNKYYRARVTVDSLPKKQQRAIRRAWDN